MTNHTSQTHGACQPHISIENTDADGDSIMGGSPQAPWNGGPPPSRFSTPQPSAGSSSGWGLPSQSTQGVAPSSGFLQVPARGREHPTGSSHNSQPSAASGEPTGGESRGGAKTSSHRAPPTGRDWTVVFPAFDQPENARFWQERLETAASPGLDEVQAARKKETEDPDTYFEAIGYWDLS